MKAHNLHGKWLLIEQPDDEFRNFLEIMEAGYMTTSIATRLGKRCISWLGIKLDNEAKIEIGVQNLMKKIIVCLPRNGKTVTHKSSDGRVLLSRIELGEEMLTQFSTFHPKLGKKPKKGVEEVVITRLVKDDEKLYEVISVQDKDGKQTEILHRIYKRDPTTTCKSCDELFTSSTLKATEENKRKKEIESSDALESPKKKKKIDQDKKE
eukprot:g3645.t1